MYPITADSSYSIQPFQLSRLGDPEKKKIYKYTQVTWPGGPITIKKCHMHKVTAATSLSGCTQNCALFMLLLNKSTVNSGYSTVNRMEAWSMMDTRERECPLMANTTAALFTRAFTPCWSARELSTLHSGWGALHKNLPPTAPLKPTGKQAHRLKWLLS